MFHIRTPDLALDGNSGSAYNRVRNISNFYGAAIKGNEFLGQALLTGVQRVAKESIFSGLNNLENKDDLKLGLF